MKLRLLATGAAREKKKRWPLSGSSLSTALTVWITWEKQPPHGSRLARCCNISLSKIAENVAALNHCCQSAAPVHHLWEIYLQEMGAFIFLKRPRRTASEREEISLILTEVRELPHNVWPQLSAINRTKYIKCLFGRRLQAFGDEMLSYGWIYIQELETKYGTVFFFFLWITTAALWRLLRVHVHQAAPMSDCQP